MAAARGPVSTEVDSPLANPKLLTDGQGFRPLATPVDTTMSLGPARPSPNYVQQLSPLAAGHLRPGNPRQVVMSSSAGGLKVSRSQVEIRRRTSQQEENNITRGAPHPVVSRPVANMAGSPMLQHRSSPQDKSAGLQIQKPSPVAAQRQVIQRAAAHTRTAGWQTPLAQHPVTPSGQQSRMLHPHPVSRSSPQQIPVQFSQQPQLRDATPTGIKSLPMYSAVRTPVSANHTSNHTDTPFRERPPDNQIVVHIGDRKVRLVSESDPSSLYSLCRRWIRSDLSRTDRTGVRDVANIPLPRPLSVAEVENAGDSSLGNGTRSDDDQCQPEIEKPVDSMTDEELLQFHVHHFKSVRKRSKDERMRKIARFKPRLALLLPGNNESG